MVEAAAQPEAGVVDTAQPEAEAVVAAAKRRAQLRELQHAQQFATQLGARTSQLCRAAQLPGQPRIRWVRTVIARGDAYGVLRLALRLRASESYVAT